MSFANVLIYIALIAYILYGKAKGWPMKTPKKLFLLPIVVVVIGFGDATHGTTKPFEVALTVIGGAISLGLGLLRGRADKISTRGGAQFVQWGALSFALFAINIGIKLIFDVVGVAAGSTFSAAGKSLVLTLGLTLLGEAIALFLRSGAATDLLNRDNRSAPARPWRSATGNSADTNPTFPADAYRSDEPRTAAPRVQSDQGYTGQQRPGLRDGAVNWLRQQVNQSTMTGSNTETPAPRLTDELRRNRRDRHDRHDHHDHHDHHHNHHGLTGPS